jgi:Protein of unknown function (DUF4236)/Bacterial SH3 domain
MGYFRFRRSIKLLPGIRWNIGKKSTSVSFGGRGLTYTLGTKGSRTTVGIPGTGISYTHVHTSKPGSAAPLPTPPPCTSVSSQTPAKRRPSSIFYTLGFVLLSIWVLGKIFESNTSQSLTAKTSSSPMMSIPFASSSPEPSYDSREEAQPNAAAPLNSDRSRKEVRRALLLESRTSPAEFAASTQVPSTQHVVRTCRVVRVAERDFLYLRAGPGSNYSVIAKIPARTREITLGHKRSRHEKTMWQEVSWDGHRGWVSEIYIEVEPEIRKANPVPLQEHSHPEIRQRAQTLPKDETHS